MHSNRCNRLQPTYFAYDCVARTLNKVIATVALIQVQFTCFQSGTIIICMIPVNNEPLVDSCTFITSIDYSMYFSATILDS